MFPLRPHSTEYEVLTVDGGEHQHKNEDTTNSQEYVIQTEEDW